MPTLTTSSANFINTYASAAVGDTIRIADAGKIALPNYFQWTKGVTIEPGDANGPFTAVLDANPLGAPAGQTGTHRSRFTPLAWFEGVTYAQVPAGQTLTFRGGIKWTFNNAAYWPDWVGKGETWHTNGLAYSALCNLRSGLNLGKVNFEQIAFFIGYGPNAEPYRSEKYPDHFSPTTYYFWNGGASPYADCCSATPGGNFRTTAAPAGWGDDPATMPNKRVIGGQDYFYNTFANSPNAIGGYIHNDVTIRDCYFDSTPYNITLITASDTAQFLVERNWFGRKYNDALQLSISTTGPQQKITIRGNIFVESPAGHERDLGNPHCDSIQIFHAAAGKVHRGLSIYNNFIWILPTSRFWTQALWLSTSQTTGETLAPVLVDNIGIGNNKGILGSFRDAYIYRNKFFVPSAYDPTVFSNAASISDQGPPDLITNGYYADNISEGLTTPTLGKKAKTEIITFRDAATQARMFIGDWSVLANLPSTVWDVFEACKRRNYVEPYQNINAFLAVTAPAGPVWFQPNDALNEFTDAPVTSHAAVVHGGGVYPVGTTVPITLPVGLEARVGETDETATGGTFTEGSWVVGTGSNTVPAVVGKRLRLRATGANTSSTVQPITYAIGSTSFTWRIRTRGENTIPRARFTASHRNAKTATQNLTDPKTGTTMQNSPYMTFAVKCRPSNLTGTKRLIMDGTGGSISIGISGSSFFYTFRNGTQGIGLTTTSGTFKTNEDITVVFSIDLTKGPNFADCVRVVINDRIWTNFSSLSWTPSALPTVTINGTNHPAMRYLTSTNWNLLADSAASNGFVGDFDYMYFTNEWVDLDNPDVVARFSSDYLGSDGSGITGNVPAIFVLGSIADLNSTTGQGANRGGGGAFPYQTSSLATTVDKGTLPGNNLTMTAVVESSDPLVGSPLTVRVKTAGWNKACNVTATLDTVTGGWTNGTISQDGFSTTLACTVGSLENGVTFSLLPSSAKSGNVTITSDAFYAPATVPLKTSNQLSITVNPATGYSGDPVTRSFRVLPASVLPVNKTLPTITGIPVDGSLFSFDVGTWSGPVVSHDIAVLATDGATILARQPATTVPTALNALGKTIFLRVWAKTADGREVIANSANFGPIMAATDEFVIALAFAPSKHAIVGYPYPWISVDKSPQLHLYTAQKKWGFAGTGAATAGDFSSTSSPLDKALRGRNGLNVSATSVYLRIDVPSSGIYRVYGGMYHSSVVNTQMQIWDGDPSTGTSRHLLALGSTGTAGFVRHVDGTSTSIADWKNASIMGGNFQEVQVNNGFMSIARPSVNGAPQISCIAVFKKGA